jgi:hypothetical protein
VSGRPWRAIVASSLAFGGALFAFVNCGPDDGTGTFPIRDAAPPKDVTVDAADAADARVTRVDAGPPVTSNGCTLHDGWQIVHPFSPVCLFEVAGPERASVTKVPLRPCATGQAKCDEIPIPREPNSSYSTYPMEPGANGFVWMLDGIGGESSCRQSMLVEPTTGDYQVGAAISGNFARGCRAIANYAGDKFSLTRSVTPTGERPLVSLVDFNGSTAFETQIAAEFATTKRSGETLFSYERYINTYDILDVPTGEFIKTARPTVIREFDPDFAYAESLWGTAFYGEFGKLEAWRLDRNGDFSPVVQKPGTHIFSTRTDGQTIFWVEGSGNEVDYFPQPKLEIWGAPYSKSAAEIQSKKRRLVDLSGTFGEARRAIANKGYYAVNAGDNDIIVVRASDGAFQRVPLDSTWGGPTPLFVDGTQVWFNHGSLIGTNNSIARITLDPWP